MTRDEFIELLRAVAQIENGLFRTRDNKYARPEDDSVVKEWFGWYGEFDPTMMYTIRRSVIEEIRSCCYVSWKPNKNFSSLKKFVVALYATGVYCVEIYDDFTHDRYVLAFFEENDAIIAIGLAESFGLGC